MGKNRKRGEQSNGRISSYSNGGGGLHHFLCIWMAIRTGIGGICFAYCDSNALGGERDGIISEFEDHA